MPPFGPTEDVGDLDAPPFAGPVVDAWKCGRNTTFASAGAAVVKEVAITTVRAIAMPVRVLIVERVVMVVSP